MLKKHKQYIVHGLIRVFDQINTWPSTEDIKNKTYAEKEKKIKTLMNTDLGLDQLKQSVLLAKDHMKKEILNRTPISELVAKGIYINHTYIDSVRKLLEIYIEEYADKPATTGSAAGASAGVAKTTTTATL